MIQVTYRKPEQQDTAFIFASWLKHARRQGDHKHMVNRVYYDNEKKRISAVLSKSVVTIVCNPEDYAHIYAWAAYSFFGDIFILHYAYVKRPYQRLGIMRELVKKLYPKHHKEQIAITHISDEVLPLIGKCNLYFNPYLIERI